MKVEKGSFGVRNIVVGDIEKAKVVYTAHYDTCAVLPFPNFITPKCLPIYILYQFVIVIPIFVIVLGITILTSWISGQLAMWAYFLSLGAMLFLLMFGPANKHTANDNTSGVTAVIDLMTAMPNDLKENTAYVLFDLEEVGLVGSSAFYSKHRKVMKDKLLVNLDCVSDGTTVLFVFRAKAKAYADHFRKIFVSDHRLEADFATKHYVYPSDQANFPVGVGVATLNKTKGGLLYMDKIHTPKDTVYRQENIQYLVEGCIRLTESLSK
jgi:aminopeptidase-like protein